MYKKCISGYKNKNENIEDDVEEACTLEDYKSLPMKIDKIGKKLKEMKFIADKFYQKYKENKGQKKGEVYENVYKIIKSNLAHLNYGQKNKKYKLKFKD